MAEHNPGVRAQHGDMIGNGLGVGWPDADIDQRDAGAVRALQMICRHLRLARRRDTGDGRILPGRRRIEIGVPGSHIAGFDEGHVLQAVFALGRIVAALHQHAAEFDEFVDVKRIIGKQHVTLELVRAGGGVMAQPVQRIIDARGAEQGQRMRRIGDAADFIGAVDDAIVHRRQVGQVEQIRQMTQMIRIEIAFHVDSLRKGEMHGNRLVADAHFQRHAVVLAQ